MKRALVMSGGGSRGAYECGAWEALSELNVRVDAAYGTSIGAVNAAFVAQGELQKCIDLWENVTTQRIFGLADDEEFCVERMLTRKRDILPFLLENFKNFKMDITPLVNLLLENLDEKRVRASGIDMGVMLTRVPKIGGCEFRLSDIPEGRLVDYIVASASAFPVFPIKEIDGEKYVDGGFRDNMPISMAIRDGAEEIIAVDIHPEPVHPEFNVMPSLRLIHPLEDLGNFLDFDQEKMKRMRRYGYYDTMKSYGHYDGVRYTFEHVSDLRVSDAARRFVRMVAQFDASFNLKGSDAVLFKELADDSKLNQLSWKNALLRGLEMCARVMEFREDALYNMETMTRRMLEFVHDRPASSEDVFRVEGRSLIVALYHAIKDDPEFMEENARRLMLNPRETLAAMYLICMDE